VEKHSEAGVWFYTRGTARAAIATQTLRIVVERCLSFKDGGN
jgi:hypothetical protein